MEDKRTSMDFFKKLLSRKLLVFAIATILLLFGKIGEDIWLYISMVYVGANIAQAILNNTIAPIKDKLNSKSSSTTTTSTSSSSSTNNDTSTSNEEKEKEEGIA